MYAEIDQVAPPAVAVADFLPLVPTTAKGAVDEVPGSDGEDVDHGLVMAVGGAQDNEDNDDDGDEDLYEGKSNGQALPTATAGTVRCRGVCFAAARRSAIRSSASF